LNSTQITHAPTWIEVADFVHVVKIEKMATAKRKSTNTLKLK